MFQSAVDRLYRPVGSPGRSKDASTSTVCLVTVHDAAFLDCPIGLTTLPDAFEAEIVQAAERGQVRASEGTVGTPSCFGSTVQEPPASAGLDPHPESDAPKPPTLSIAKSP